LTETLLAEARSLQQGLPPNWVHAMSSNMLAGIHLARGDDASASELVLESLRTVRTVNNPPQLGFALSLSAEIALAGGAPESAARLLAAVAVLREAMGILDSSRDERHERLVAEAQAALPLESFAAAQAAGASASRETMIEEAIRVLTALPPPKPGSPAAASTDGLTRRERDVLRLVAEGLTDREIAGALFIGDRTVESHLGNVFAKLDLHSRSAAAVYAVRHGLA
jgi:DNA-binding CsgD family transcriptional regulator